MDFARLFKVPRRVRVYVPIPPDKLREIMASAEAYLYPCGSGTYQPWGSTWGTIYGNAFIYDHGCRYRWKALIVGGECYLILRVSSRRVGYMPGIGIYQASDVWYHSDDLRWVVFVHKVAAEQPAFWVP